jgi:pimeloyl-ACP methyl ester carboxylesterase
VVEGNYAKVNKLDLYYEVVGTGMPLILLHGGLGGISDFAKVMPVLTKSCQVIGVELQAHGHTADIDRPLSFESMADDIAGLMNHLHLDQVDLCGYSLGGGVALQTAFRHPQLVRRLVVVSTPCKTTGWYPESRVGMASLNAEIGRSWIGSPMQQAYARIAPNPENWTVLIEKMGQLLRRDYDWSAQVAGLKIPVMVVIGDADAVQPAHAVDFFSLLGGGQRDADWDRSGMSRSRLAVLPSTSHYDIFSSPRLASIILPFLEEEIR